MVTSSSNYLVVLLSCITQIHSLTELTVTLTAVCKPLRAHSALTKSTAHSCCCSTMNHNIAMCYTMLQWTAASCLSIYTASSSLHAVPVVMPGESYGEMDKADIDSDDSLGVKIQGKSQAWQIKLQQQGANRQSDRCGLLSL